MNSSDSEIRLNSSDKVIAISVNVNARDVSTQTTVLPEIAPTRDVSTQTTVLPEPCQCKEVMSELKTVLNMLTALTDEVSVLRQSNKSLEDKLQLMVRILIQCKCMPVTCQYY